MSKFKSRHHRRRNKHMRIRNRISGTPERPRLCVYRSLKHMYAQVVDDERGHTLAFASTLKSGGGGGTVAAAKEVGKAIAEEAKKQGIERVVFDRAGYIFRGRVRALADAAREAGLKF